MRQPIQYLNDILQSLRLVNEFVEAFGLDLFLSDMKTRRAVVAEFLVIGEAAARLPERIRTKYNDVPWSAMIGMRNRLIHG